MSVPQLVVVNFQYEYTARDGSQVSIQPNERYVLVAKTNDHWWHVRKDEATKPFFIPAKYVTELPPEDNWDFPAPPAEEGGQDPPKPSVETEPPNEKQSSEVTIRDPMSIKRDSEKDGHRISTFIIPQDLYDFSLFGSALSEVKSEQDTKPCDPYKDVTEVNSTQSGTPSSLPLTEEETPYSISPSHFPSFLSQGKETETSSVSSKISSPTSPKELKEDIDMLRRAGWDLKIWDLMEDDIYETIDKKKDQVVKEPQDNEAQLVLDSDSLASPSMPVSTKKQTPGTPTGELPKKVEDEDLSAVYVNVPRARRTASGLPGSSASTSLPSWSVPDTPESPESPLELPEPPRLGSEAWEIHTDQQSGQQYYYQPSTGHSTWDPPSSPFMESDVGTEDPLPSPSPVNSAVSSPSGPSPPRWSSDWERVLDESSGRHYYFNQASGESSWDLPEELQDSVPPPLPEEDYPPEEDVPVSPRQDDAASAPFSLTSEYSLAHVKKAFIPRAGLDHSAPAGWTLNIEPDGAWVFTSEHTQEQWIKSLDDRGQTYYYLRDGSKSQWTLPELSAGVGQYRVGNGGTLNHDGVRKSWRNSTGSQDERLYSVSHRRNASDSDASSSPETPHNVSNLEKAGILNRTKICENGKKVRKNWAASWTVLHGGILTFHKDPKSTPNSAASKTNQFVPEFTVDLKGATIGWAAKEKSSKKNVLELKSRAGAEFLVQYDTESIVTDWHKIITDTIRQLDMEHHHSEEEEEVSEKSSSTEKEDRPVAPIDKRRTSTAGRQLSSNSTSEADQKKVRTKLRKFLLKRPTLQSVKEKGYIRENVFGCHLHNLCAQEKTTVPSFVEKCIRMVEKRGLGIDGLYRVSGNLAVIQKLRFRADHEDLNLEEGTWDIHVITGALKLFFRELQEPLFPYSHFHSFVQGIKIPDYHSRVSYMSDLVRSLPAANHDTMEVLFSHLRKVIEHGEENRMTVQNVAIVFGPTLLKPEVESANITMYMVFQNQIIEFILNEFETIFHM
ncbi:rho GTPase-activating protein 27 isoform X2 [Hoplias malabaricus]|uniref:rho GTPase-activating protein 27 isoform X2 n=1 Tax=Hoplias malabaricus TaxID=27720 RepID=UPI0034628EB5